MAGCITEILRKKKIDFYKVLMNNPKIPGSIRIMATKYRAQLVRQMREEQANDVEVERKRTINALAVDTQTYDDMIKAEGDILRAMKAAGDIDGIAARTEGANSYWDTQFIPTLKARFKRIKEWNSMLTRQNTTLSNLNIGVGNVENLLRKVSVTNTSGDAEAADLFKDVGDEFEFTPTSALISAPGASEKAYMQQEQAATDLAQPAANDDSKAADDAFKVDLMKRMGMYTEAPRSQPVPTSERESSSSTGVSGVGSSKSSRGGIKTEFDRAN